MSIWRMIFANLSYSRRQHLGTCLGLALASMILVGSLTIGDSVRATLSYKKRKNVFVWSPMCFYPDMDISIQTW